MCKRYRVTRRVTPARAKCHFAVTHSDAYAIAAGWNSALGRKSQARPADQRVRIPTVARRLLGSGVGSTGGPAGAPVEAVSIFSPPFEGRDRIVVE